MPGQMVGRKEGEKELTTAGLGTRSSHPDPPRIEWIKRGLIRQDKTRPPPTVAPGVAALDHEVGDHAVETEAVVKTVSREVRNLS